LFRPIYSLGRDGLRKERSEEKKRDDAGKHQSLRISKVGE